MNTYMLAAIIRRKTGQTLTEYLTPRLYEPLGIEAHPWETCPNGTEKGGWGLSLTMESAAKIGQLYLNKGRWETEAGIRQLVSERWVEQATRPQIDTPKGEITFGYGHQIWMTARKGAFLFNGAFGQYMLALPDRNALVVLFSGTSRLFANGGLLDQLTAALDTVHSLRYLRCQRMKRAEPGYHAQRPDGALPAFVL
jgi:CubicO group peptidase (beta-lactamase class C family)